WPRSRPAPRHCPSGRTLKAPTATPPPATSSPPASPRAAATRARGITKTADRRHSTPLSPVLGREGRGEGPNRQLRAAAVREGVPLTLTLPPEYRGEGTREDDGQADRFQRDPPPDAAPAAGRAAAAGLERGLPAE